MMAVSRRGVLARLAAGVVAAGAYRGVAAAQQKVGKAEAKYQGGPNGVQRCEICMNFEPPDQCRFVTGPISKNGWCQFFAAREGAH